MCHKLDDSEPHQSILHTGSLEEGEGNRWWDDKHRIWRWRAGLEPAACMQGRLRTRGWLAHFCWRRLGSARGMGSFTMHAKTWNWRQMRERASLFWYHKRWQVSADSVMWQLQPIKCVYWCLSQSLHRPTGGRKPIFVTSLYAGH